MTPAIGTPGYGVDPSRSSPNASAVPSPLAPDGEASALPTHEECATAANVVVHHLFRVKHGHIRPPNADEAAVAVNTLMNHAAALLTTLTARTAALAEAEARAERAEAKAAKYDRINTPEVADFLSAVENEALHQRERWGVDADGGKEASDWFWLVGYLAGKALHDVKGKRLHHLITTAAALLNWHGQETGHYARMRPGIDPAAIATPTRETTTDE